MKIRLKDVPDLGATYHMTRKTGELTDSLSDLIGAKPYEVHFFIKPLADDTNFEFRGSIKTASGELCSRCGDDFVFSIDQTFKELLIPGADLPRDGFYAKPNHISDLSNDGPSVVEYRGDSFDLGEYLHEVVGMEIPFNPVPAEDKDGNCSQCHLFVRGKSFDYHEPFEKPESPFSVLKKIKVDHKDH